MTQNELANYINCSRTDIREAKTDQAREKMFNETVLVVAREFVLDIKRIADALEKKG